jgi:hypothetical protein
MPARAPTAPVTARPPGAPAAPDRAQPPTDRRVRVLTFLCVVLGLLTILFGIMAFAPSSSPIKTGAVRTVTQASAESELRNVAQQFSQTVINYDYRSVDDTIRKVKTLTTDSFAEQYHTALRGDLNVYRRRILELKAVATGELRSVSVQSIEDDTATVIVLSTQTLRSRKTSGAERRFNLLELALVKTSSGWKVDSARLPAAVTEQQQQS